MFRYYIFKIKVLYVLLVVSFIFFIGTYLTLVNTSNDSGSSRHSIAQRIHPDISTFLFIIIPSKASNHKKRDTIRNTWLKFGLKKDFEHIFIVGGDNSNIADEIKQHNDVLWLQNLNDSYDSLTEKVLQAFVYVDNKVEFEYLLKCDDDSFVRIPDMVVILKDKFHGVRNLYWGFFDGSARIKKKGPWKETNWMLCDYYLPYALGGGYVLSRQLIHYIATNNKYFNIYKTEDVSVGTWLAPVNVTRYHDTRFDTEYRSRGCSNSYLVTHKKSEQEMTKLYNSLIRNNNLCETEYQSRPSYKYNWSNPPSKCCQRDWELP